MNIFTNKRVLICLLRSLVSAPTRALNQDLKRPVSSEQASNRFGKDINLFLMRT